MISTDFQKLIESLSLTLIQPTKIEFERQCLMPEDTSEIQISWKILYPNESFVIRESFLELFPLFEVTLLYEKEIIFTHKSIISVILSIKDMDVFTSIWKDDEIQKFFKEKQLVKTLWPMVRQQVLDGMSRLGLPPIPLPWLF